MPDPAAPPDAAEAATPSTCRRCGTALRGLRAVHSGLCRRCREERARRAEADGTRQAISSLLDRDDVLVLDTETTGLGAAEVIELSVIDTRGQVRLNTLVKPRQRAMNPYAQRVHGISLEMLDEAPSWPEVLPELVRLTRRTTVLAWNAGFDARMLEQTSSAWGLSHPTILFVCAMNLYGRLYRSRRRGLHQAVRDAGLEHLLERYRSHRALADVRFVLEVLRAQADGIAS